MTQPLDFKRNAGMALDLGLVNSVKVNRNAADRRAASLANRRTVKKEYQAAWLVRAIECIDLTTLGGDDTPGDPALAAVTDRFVGLLGADNLVEFSLTPFDHVGVPVWQSWWSEGERTSGGIGYGPTQQRARVGALGECVEHATAARSLPSSRLEEGSLAELRARLGEDAVVDPRTLGMLLFIGSEIMLFGSFFAAYFFVRVVNPGAPDHWPPEPYHFPVFVAGVNTAILVTSSFTMHWALEGARNGNRRALRAGLVTTLGLGLTFLTIQINEYVHIGFAPSDNAQGSIFYGLTGLHGAHVFVGLTLLTFATVRAFRGHFSIKQHRGVEVPGIYWHFVDVMWIVVYTTIYII